MTTRPSLTPAEDAVSQSLQDGYFARRDKPTAERRITHALVSTYAVAFAREIDVGTDDVEIVRATAIACANIAASCAATMARADNRHALLEALVSRMLDHAHRALEVDPDDPEHTTMIKMPPASGGHA